MNTIHPHVHILYGGMLHKNNFYKPTYKLVKENSEFSIVKKTGPNILLNFTCSSESLVDIHTDLANCGSANAARCMAVL